MLVNDIYDLQDINLFLHGNYALSRNINAIETRNWANGKGFKPLTLSEEHITYSDKFDGNNFIIDGLFINRPEEKDIGLFGIVAGQKMAPAEVTNLKLENSYIHGYHYVGGIAGDSEYAIFSGINIISGNITGADIVGGVIGTAKDVSLHNIIISHDIYQSLNAYQYKGLILGSAENTHIYNAHEICSNESLVQCVGYAKNIDYL